MEELEDKRSPVYTGKQEPTNPFEGMLWVDTLRNTVWMYNTHIWIPVTYIPAPDAGIIRHTHAPSIEIDWSQGKVHSAQIEENTTFVFNNPSDGGRYLLIIKEGNAGGYTPTFPSTVHWINNTTPTFVTTVNTYIIVSFVYTSMTNTYFAINSDGYV
jgi:hypothetical protein